MFHTTLTIGELREQLEQIPRELDDLKIQSFNKEGKLTHINSTFYVGGSYGRYGIEDIKESHDIHKDFWAALIADNLSGIEVNKEE